MQPKISVIIPVYNTEPYLRRCLDSVINQTLHDIEIICVDDASIDNSFAILNEYAKCDARVKVLQNSHNLGDAATRNVALSYATGEYLGFFDSDDYIGENFFGELYNNATTFKADISKGRRQTVNIDGTITRFDFNSTIIKNKYYFNKEFTTAIYKHDFLKKHNLCFHLGVTNRSDIVFLIQAVHWANSVVCTDAVCYYCEKRPESLSHGMIFSKIKESGFITSNLIVDFLNSISINMDNYLHTFSSELLSLLRIGCFSHDLDTANFCFKIYSQCKYKEQLKSYIPFAFFIYLKNGNTTGLISFFNKMARLN